MNKVFQNIEHVSSCKYRAGILCNNVVMQQNKMYHFTHTCNLTRKKKILAQKKLPVKASRVQQKRAVQCSAVQWL